MTKFHSKTDFPLGIHKQSEIDLSGETGENTALVKILQTREARQLLSKILPDVLNLLAKDSKIEKFVMKAVGKLLGRRLSRPHDVLEEKEFALLFKDEAFIKNISVSLPENINGLLDIIVSMTKTIEAMPTEKKKAVFGDVIANITAGKSGDIINRSCRIIKDLHKEDPEFFTNTMAPGFQKWVESVDFGEIREMLNTSAEDGRAFVMMVNHVFWLYPSKVVMVLSMVPSLMNLFMEILDISLGRLNHELPPDMEADVIIALAKDLNINSAVDIFNQLMEVVRKVHVGSALMGEGTPVLSILLSNIIGQVIEKTDPVTFWKAKIALAETKATISEGVARSINSRPDFKHLSMIKGPELTNIHLKSINKRLTEWDAEDDEEMAHSFAQHMAAYDIQEIAEVFNNTLRIINRLGGERPAVFAELVTQLVNAIDDNELAETAKRFFKGVSKELKPVARAVIPGVVTWICDVIKPEDDEHEEEAGRARDALRDALASTLAN
jgi:hypothetical protein